MSIANSPSDEEKRQRKLAYLREYRIQNLDRLRAQQRRYYQANKEKRLAQNKVYREANKEKIAAKRREYYQANKAYHLGLSRRRYYGITVEETEALLAEQGGKCPICGTSEPKGRGWHVDHCHETGAVRGILCGRCNMGLGCFSDDAERLALAVEYLRRGVQDREGSL